MGSLNNLQKSYDVLYEDKSTSSGTTGSTSKASNLGKSYDVISTKPSQSKTQQKAQPKAHTTVKTTVKAAPQIDNTRRNTLAYIDSVHQQDVAAANELYSQYQTAAQVGTSPYFAPYTQPTNKSKAILDELDIDTSNVNQDWYNAYDQYMNYLPQTGYTNNYSTPKKRAPKEQKLGYAVYQYHLAEDDTVAAETEWKAAQDEMRYWLEAGLSPDEVIQKLNISGNSKYKTLNKMDETRKLGTPMELNRAIGYNGEDDLYTYMWQVMNDGGSGNYMRDMINCAYGNGNTWQADPELDAKRDRNRYSVRMVGMDDAGTYFGRNSFDWDWYNENYDEDNTDPEYVRMMQKVYTALETTDKAKEQKAELDKYLERKLGNVYTDKDVQSVLEGIDWDDLGVLEAMDKSLGKNGRKGNGKWVSTTEPIDYCYQDIVDRVNAAKEENSKKLNGDDTVNSYTPPSNQVEFVQSGEEPLTPEQQDEIDHTVGTDIPGSANANMPAWKVRQEAEFLAAKEAFTAGDEFTGEDDEQRYREAYDKKYGEGAYDQAMSAENPAEPSQPEANQQSGTTGRFSAKDLPIVASSTPGIKPTQGARQAAAKTGTQLTEDTLNAKTKDAFSVLENSMTLAERTHFQNIPGVEYDRIREGMIQGPLNPQLWEDPNFKEYNFRKAEANANNNYKKTALDTLATRREHEALQAEAEQIRTEVEKAWETYGDDLYASEPIPEGDLVITLANGQEVIVPEEYTEEGYVDLDSTNGVDTLEELFFRQGLEATDEILAEINNKLRIRNEDAEKIRKAKEKYGDTLPEGMPTLDEVNQATNRLNSLEQQIADGQGAYDEAIAQMNDATRRQAMMSELLLRNGFDVESVANIDALLSTVEGLAGFQPPEATTSTLAYQLAHDVQWSSDKAGKLKEVASDEKEIDEAIKDAKFLIRSIEGAPQEYIDSINRYIDYLNSQKQQYEGYKLTLNDNFNEYVERGKLLERTLKPGFVLTDGDDFEEKLYYGILGRYGQDAADAYYKDIEPTLLAATKANINANTEELAQSGWLGRVLNMGFAIAEAPLDVLGSALDIVHTAVTGEGNDWLRIPANISQSAYSATQAEIAEVYKDQPLLKDAITTVNEMIYNRGRSAVTGLVFGPLFPAGTGEVIQAMPIALTAADETLQKYLDAGVEPTKAAALATVAFLSESVTEGIELGNIKKAFHVGEDITKNALVTFFKDYIPNALPEIVGESINDIAEKMADYWIAGEKGDLQGLMESYKARGMSDDEAYEMMMRDQIADVAHTAFISLLSPIMDLGPLAAGEILSYSEYAAEARRMRNSGANPTATARSLRQGDVQMIKAAQNAQEAFELREPGTMFANEPKIIRPEITTNGFSEEAQEANTASYDQTITVLDGLKDSNQTATAAGVSAALQTSEADSNLAGATAAGIDTVLEGDSIGKLQDLFYGGYLQNININILKKGIQYAVTAAGRCRNIMTSDAFQRAQAETQAQWLAEAVAEDAQNQQVQDESAEAVHEFRVAEEEKRLMAEGAGDAAVTAKENIDAAKQETEAAKDELEKRTDDVESKQEAAKVAGEEATNNPTDENVNEATKATNELAKSVESEDQYQQHLDKTERQEQETTAKEQRVINQTAADIRQQAEANVRQREQAEAEAAAAAAVAAQQEQERLRKEQEQKIAEEKEKSRQAAIDRGRQLGEERADQLGLKNEERDAFVQRYVDRAEKAIQSKADMSTAITLNENGEVTNAEGLLALRAFENKTGLKILFEDLGDPTVVRGKYANGVVTLNKQLITNGSMTTGQALVEAALHEMTHAFEATKSYKKYANTIKGILFGDKNATYENNAKMHAAVDQKIADYKKAGITLTREDAEREIIADYARTSDLHSKDSVARFMDAGLGGQMRNTLHNINQAIKNFRLTGDAKVTAENLRRAERAYQKALEEFAKTQVHPTSEQFSVSQFAQASGLDMTYDEDTLELRLKDGTVVDGVNVKITPDMMVNTPVGRLIEMGLGDEQKEAARKMFADLMNLCARYRDNNLIWEIAGSEFAESFSALKSNSDPQYKTTVDFGTICAKTQAIVDTISGTMLKKIQEIREWNAKPENANDQRIFTGLTREDVMQIYDTTHNAKLSVPCPVCYVFSRWMGVPSLLGQMNKFQHEFVATKKDANGQTLYDENGDAVIDWDITKERVDKYISDIIGKYGGKKGISEAKTKLDRKIKGRADSLPNLRETERDLQKQLGQDSLTNAETKKLNGKLDTVQKKIRKNIQETDQFMAEMENINAYNWVSQALCKQHYDKQARTYVNDIGEDGNFVLDEEGFRLTPEEVLFDMNRTGEFAGYAKNWRYRTTRGAGMGKAIMPYSGASIGDIINGDAKRWTDADNPFITNNPEIAKSKFESAKKRVMQQNLVGGQRFQSTSDFRPEWGLDYVMSFLEMQALGSKVQMYTKVIEAVDFLGSIGADVNLSVMGQGDGYREATPEEIEQAKTDRKLRERMGVLDGKTYILEFSDTTGISYNGRPDYEGAWEKTKKFNNVQMILVGMNNNHIRLAIGSDAIDFVIPWHSSGNSKDILQTLVASVNESLKESMDYTDVQTDKIKSHEEKDGKKTKTVDDRTEAEINLWNARVKMLTEGVDSLTQDERNILLSNEFTKDLYNRFNDPNNKEYYGVTLPQAQAEQIFPYEYWDTNSTRENADVNGQRFAAYCDALGLVPRFSEFVNDPGYWKLLIDRKMYDNNVLNDDGTVKEYGKYRPQQVVDVTKASIGQLPSSTTAKYGANYSTETNNAIELANDAVPTRYSNQERYSAFGDVTDADIDQDIAQSFSEQYDEWDGSDANKQMVLGTTSEILESIGLPPCKISISGGTIIHSKSGHPEMTDDLIKQLPSIIERPMIVMESKTVPGRITMFGELIDGNGNPVLAIMETVPTYNRTLKAETLEIVNAYGKDRNPQGFINTSNILYVDKERASDWASGLRLQLPSSATVADSTGNNVAQVSDAVNEQFSALGDSTDADIDQDLAANGITGQDETAMPLEGQNPLATSAAPGAQRQFGQGMLQDSDEIDAAAKRYVLAQNSYIPDTNPQQIDRAIDWIRSNKNNPTSDGLYESIDKIVNGDFDYRSADGQARMVSVMGLAVAKGDTFAQITLADAFNRQGTDLGRALQARKLFRLMTPDGREGMMKKLLQDTKNDIANLKDAPDLKFSQWIYEAARAATTEADFEKVKNAAISELAEQIPANWKDRVRTWRMISMLANPRTHVRNVLGNGVFVPVVQLKNIIGAGLESKFVKEGSRTKSIRYTDDAKEFAKQDLERMKNQLTGEAKYSPESKIKQEQKAFGQGKSLLSRTLGKAVQSVSDFNSWALEAEDWMFLSYHYQNALAGYMTANKLTSADMKGKTLDAARSYALLEAQKATYRDANKISSKLNEISREGGFWGFVVDAVLPFKKTPANILRRGIEYSPIGLVKSIVTAKRSLDAYARWEANGKKGDMPKNAKNMTQVLDGLASGLSGTAIAAMGAFLYSIGAVKLGYGGDKDDELKKERGEQEYSVELFGHSFTIDWAAPVCMPFFTGASLYKTYMDEFAGKEDLLDAFFETDWGAFLDSMSQISEPIFNLSMLDGVSSLLKTAGFGMNGLWQLAQKTGANYVGSLVPSVFGAAARTIDTTRRQNFVESGASLRAWRQALEQAQNKIPFLSMRNIPYRDVWGNTDESSYVEAFIENFISPGYFNKIKEDKLIDELERIFKDTGDSAVIPKEASNNFTINKEKINLKDKQYDEYRVKRGQTAKNLLDSLIETDEFKALTDNNPEGQAKMIKDVWEYANQTAKHEMYPDSKMDSWIAKAYANGDVLGEIFQKEEKAAKQAYAQNANKELIQAIDSSDADAMATCVEALKQSGKQDKDIRSYLTQQYKKAYQQAYLEEDETLMKQIQDNLSYLDLGKSSYKPKDFTSWEKEADKSREEE